MTILSVVALALPAIAVYLGLREIWPRSAIPWHPPIGISAALGLSTGFSSLVYFGLLFLGLRGATLIRLDAGVWLVAILWLTVRAVRTRVPPRVDRSLDESARTDKWLPLVIVMAIGLGLLFLIAIGSHWLAWIRHPNGQWDAWSIWNLRARSIVRGAPDWPSLFSPIIAWSNPDYPLLLPLTVARLWTYEGREPTTVPAAIAMLFFLATLGFMAVSVGRRSGWAVGVLSGIVLLIARTYVFQSSCQCADVPLGFFFLVGTVCLVLAVDSRAASSLFVVAGAAAGLAAWTKNEGVVFFALLLVAGVVSTRRFRAPISIVAGAAVPLAALVVFKWRLAPPNYLFGRQAFAALLEKMADPARWSMVSTRVMDRLPGWGEVWGGAILWLGVAVVLTVALDRRAATRALAGILLVGAMLAGYVLVYVITPLPLDWQIATSFDRLITQLWPSLVWSAFQVTGSPTTRVPEPDAARA